MSFPATQTMSPALMLALLVITLALPRARALDCHFGVAETVRNVSEQPLRWTTSQKNCGEGLGCQETVMIAQNELFMYLVLLKGCTEAANQEARVTEHSTGPGLSIISYTRVCRKNLCNDLATSLPLWSPRPPKVPGSVRCPVCLSAESCLSAPELTCPAESSHCYNGVLHLTAGGGTTRLPVQGCISQPGCNLLNGTRQVGPISLQETCYPQGHRSILLGSKGCSQISTPAITIHSRPPGVLVASYARVCSSDYCNSAADSSVLVNALPRPAAPAPGHLQCPSCLVLGSCSESSNVMCPQGTSHCYKGQIFLSGGGVTTPVGIQGCVAHPSSTLLNRRRSIGVFNVLEEREGDDEVVPPPISSGAAPGPSLAWVVGLGLSLALWCGAPSLLTLFPHDP
ncbi:CD177 antigen isoform X2 [Cervus elaphus]|uniref:CD177 antigen isoform X2 n=1 Tax=Cervus elaphus TaxID=9860 RepID=UPI001CC2703A|nr:CD177 antigen isoform X2 [Cervus elaphus]